MKLLNEICPVCGMKAQTGVPTEEHHKMFFHFCSEQCRETFIARPSLYSTKVGKVRKATLKRRTISLSETLEHEITDLLIPYLMAMMGVKEVTVEGNKLHITYDLLQVTESQIEKALVEAGLQLGGDWLERLRRGWAHSSEEVELDNLSTPRYHHSPPLA